MMVRTADRTVLVSTQRALRQEDFMFWLLGITFGRHVYYTRARDRYNYLAASILGKDVYVHMANTALYYSIH